MFNLLSTLPAERVKTLSPVVLAFVGDAVYSLYVREKLVLNTDFSTGTLQKLASNDVSAHGQSELLNTIFERFTEEEAEIFRRGRNAKKPTRSKNASVAEYNRSTGFEAVLGFLYLTARYERIDELLSVENEN